MTGEWAPQPTAIALVGPMAAGKSSLGKKLARALGRPFIDTDKEIAREHGPIPEIFAVRGEAAFRALEAAAVRDALRPGRVVALGGGAVLDAGTRALLGDVDVVLVTVAATAVERRLRGGGRPLVADGIAAWERIAAEREPIYRSLADVTVDTSASPMAGIVDELVAWAHARPALAAPATYDGGAVQHADPTAVAGPAPEHASDQPQEAQS